MDSVIISVQNLHKRYGKTKAVDGIDLAISNGEVFGILGPNGAGKTTTIEILEGLRTQDSGEIEVAGFHPRKRSPEFHQIIGVQLQHTALFQRIRVGEALKFFRNCYPHGARSKDLLQRFDLVEKEKNFVKDLSGGERQRLTLALSVINNPQVIFLDEPTTGMDPHARRSIWKIIEEYKQQKKTILLTTHNMEEAERLCDRIAIIDQGKIITLGTPRELIRALGANKKITFSLKEKIELEVLNSFPEVSKSERQNGEYILYSAEPQKVLLHILSKQPTAGMDLLDLRISHANLEDVFIHLTGRKLS